MLNAYFRNFIPMVSLFFLFTSDVYCNNKVKIVNCHPFNIHSQIKSNKIFGCSIQILKFRVQHPKVKKTNDALMW